MKVLHNYFSSLIKLFSDLYLAKFLDTSVKCSFCVPKERQKEGELYLWHPISYSWQWFIVAQFAGWFIPTQGYPSHGSRSPNIRYHWEHLYHAVTHLRATFCNLRRARAYIASESLHRCAMELSPWLFPIAYWEILPSLRRFELVVTNNEEESFLYLGCKIKLPSHRCAAASSFDSSLPFFLQSRNSLVLSFAVSSSFSRILAPFYSHSLESSSWKRFVRALDRHSSPIPKLRTRWWGKSNVPREKQFFPHSNDHAFIWKSHVLRKMSIDSKSFGERERERERERESARVWRREEKKTYNPA